MTSSTAIAFGVAVSLAMVGPDDDARDAARREEVLRRAQVWIDPGVPIEQARLDANPPGADSFAVDAEVECEFEPQPLGGNTPKFDCTLEKGEKIRVKYGRDNQEIYAEVAASDCCRPSAFPPTTSTWSSGFGASVARRIRSRPLSPA